jgi:hypothetical protein
MKEEKRHVYRILILKPDGKRPAGGPRRRWVNIIKWILERENGVVRNGSVWPN